MEAADALKFVPEKFRDNTDERAALINRPKGALSNKEYAALQATRAKEDPRAYQLRFMGASVEQRRAMINRLEESGEVPAALKSYTTEAALNTGVVGNFPIPQEGEGREAFFNKVRDLKSQGLISNQQMIDLAMSEDLFDAINKRNSRFKFDGYIPNFVSNPIEGIERAGAYAAGYTPGLVREREGMVYNTAEEFIPSFTLEKMTGMKVDGPAIIPPRGEARNKTLTALTERLGTGAREFAAEGMVPNFADLGYASWAKATSGMNDYEWGTRFQKGSNAKKPKETKITNAIDNQEADAPAPSEIIESTTDSLENKVAVELTNQQLANIQEIRKISSEWAEGVNRSPQRLDDLRSLRETLDGIPSEVISAAVAKMTADNLTDSNVVDPQEGRPRNWVNPIGRDGTLKDAATMKIQQELIDNRILWEDQQKAGTTARVAPSGGIEIFDESTGTNTGGVNPDSKVGTSSDPSLSGTKNFDGSAATNTSSAPETDPTPPPPKWDQEAANALAKRLLMEKNDRVQGHVINPRDKDGNLRDAQSMWYEFFDKGGINTDDKAGAENFDESTVANTGGENTDNKAVNSSSGGVPDLGDPELASLIISNQQATNTNTGLNTNPDQKAGTGGDLFMGGTEHFDEKTGTYTNQPPKKGTSLTWEQWATDKGHLGRSSHRQGGQKAYSGRKCVGSITIIRTRC